MKFLFSKEFFFRVLTAFITFFLFSFLLFFSKNSYFMFLFPFFASCIGALAVAEYGNLVRGKGVCLFSPVMVGVSFGEILFFFLASQSVTFLAFPFFLFFLHLVFLFFYHAKKMEQAIVEIATSCFPFLYIVVPIALSFFILYSPFYEGRFWILYLIAVTKAADIGGYFGGKLLGKYKLAPKISPHKTREGAFVGWLFSLLVSFSFYGFSEKMTLFESLFLGALMGVFGQMGDLFESLFKRDAKKKDSNSIPGIGGVLDLLDSLIFNLFVLFFFLYWR